MKKEKVTMVKLPHRILLIIFFLIGIIHNAYTQSNPLIDSLEHQLRQGSKTDTSKINLLIELSFNYRNVNPDKGIACGNEAAQLADNAGRKAYKAKALNCLALNYFFKSDYHTSLNYALLSLRIFEELKDTLGMAKVLGNIGLNYFDRLDVNTANSYFTKALNLYKQLGNKKGISATLSNIGLVYSSKGQYELALKCHKESLDFNIAIGNKENTGINYNNIGEIYLSRGDYDSSVVYYSKALETHKELGNLLGTASVLSYLGDVYKKKSEDKTYSNDKDKNAQMAVDYYNQALPLFLKTGSKQSIFVILKNLSQVQTTLGDTKQAFENYKLYTIYKDSVYTQKNAENLLHLEMTYNSEKLATEAKHKAELEKAENERKEYVQIAGIFTFLLSLTSVLLLLRKRKIKPWILKILGTFSLLVIFEFISLLLHPHITHITHHNMVLTLLCLVLLASIIVPTHHKIEHWMHEKLVKYHITTPEEPREENPDSNENKQSAET